MRRRPSGRWFQFPYAAFHRADWYFFASSPGAPASVISLDRGSVAEAVMNGALLVAHASGIELDRDAARARALEIRRAAHTATSSTQQDIARGRPTEIDSLNGFFAMRAEKCGLKAPVNGTLAALVSGCPAA